MVASLRRMRSLLEAPPPHPPSLYLTPRLWHIFAKFNAFLFKFGGSSTLKDVGSARRSSTAGSSDNNTPKPLLRFQNWPPRVLM